MNQDRISLYDKLNAEIGNTPLYKISKIDIPRGNAVFAKEENKNPGGSHYDRVFINLFRHFEEQGKIIPYCTPVVETTSGSAGVSFARLAKLLGYECLVICPENLPEARLEAIANEGAELRLTPKKGYTDESSAELGRIFKVENKKRKDEGKVPYFSPNHTQDEAADIAAKSVEAVVDEAVAQAAEQYNAKFDLVVAVGGNGTTALGFGRAAKRHNIPMVLWETLNSGLYFSKRFSQCGFIRKYGIAPGFDKGNHQVYGSAYGPTAFELKNIDQAIEEGLIYNVTIITDRQTKEKVLNIVSNNFNKVVVSRLPVWEPSIGLLRNVEGKPVGRTSAGNLAVILDSNWGIKDMNILTFFYDDLSRY